MIPRSVIAVDAREAFGPRRTGKGQWTRGFLEELVRRDVVLRLFVAGPVDGAWAGNAEIVRVGGTGPAWHAAVARRVGASPDIGAYVSPTSYIVPALLSPAVPCVPVVHDLIAFRSEPHDRKARLIERLTLKRAMRRAAAVLTVSESTKHDLLARFPTLDPTAVTPVFAGPLRATVPPSRPDGKTILCIATLCPRKNQERLIRAYASLPEDLRAGHRLLLVGARGWQDGGIVRLAHETVGVEWRDYVPDDEYESLLSTCAVFALPSLYEGFGMQILDALQRGIPVLTSQGGSLREVAGDAACVVDPLSIESITAGLDRLLREEAFRQELSRKGPIAAARFSWARTADLALSAIAAVQRHVA